MLKARMVRTNRIKLSQSTIDMFKHETDVQKPICPVCLCRIESSDEMEIAHIKSCFNYGTNDLFNLIATHNGMCNVGTTSIQPYIDEAPDDLKKQFLRFVQN